MPLNMPYTSSHRTFNCGWDMLHGLTSTLLAVRVIVYDTNILMLACEQCRSYSVRLSADRKHNKAFLLIK
jgi:hypothetical protein